ncbi:Uncharacterised protein [Mycobacteroides abscessus subsp. abscessus]|nr:Uncharacterised protein [Mycobacteroides abscessus subsp. abscessus]
MSLLTALNREWTEFLVHSPVPTSWTEAVPELVACISPGDVLALVPDFSEEILRGLVALAQVGDHLAARTVLQAMLPKLVRMATTGTARGHCDGFDDLVAAMVGRIQSHPLHRTSAVAGNLALDSLKDALAIWGADSPTAELALPDEVLDYVADGARSVEADFAVGAVLEAGTSQGWISDSMRELLGLVYGPDGASSATVAAQLGCQPATVRSRCRDGINQLRRHRVELLELV